MRIALRTSGGRGEYELAGRQGDVHSTSFSGLELFFRLSPALSFSTRSAVNLSQGKPRIRLLDGGEGRPSHSYLLLAACLLMPRPKRELAVCTARAPGLVDNDYSITSIAVDVDEVSEHKVFLRPTSIWIGNSSGKKRRISISSRLRTVASLWEWAGENPSELATQLISHREAVHGGLHDQMQRARNAIVSPFANQQDCLPELCMATISECDTGLEEDVSADGDVTEEEKDWGSLEARRRNIREWRLLAYKGARGRKFRESVREAYGSTCAFCGLALPRTSVTRVVGVDCAHILPWSEYDLELVSNGICLCKNCHWAFDAGALRVDYSPAQDSYLLLVPPRVRECAPNQGMTLRPFLELEGPICAGNLPEDRREWPSPRYLSQLNELQFED